MSHSQRLSLSWAKSAQFLVMIPIYLRSILILYSHLSLGLPKGLFPVDLPVKILKALLRVSSSILATWPAYLNNKFIWYHLELAVNSNYVWTWVLVLVSNNPFLLLAFPSNSTYTIIPVPRPLDLHTDGLKWILILDHTDRKGHLKSIMNNQLREKIL